VSSIMMPLERVADGYRVTGETRPQGAPLSFNGCDLEGKGKGVDEFSRETSVDVMRLSWLGGKIQQKAVPKSATKQENGSPMATTAREPMKMPERLQLGLDQKWWGAVGGKSR